MTAVKDRAIEYAIGFGPGFVVWESPDKVECRPIRDHNPSPGPGWVKVWPPDEEKVEPSLANLYERLTTLTEDVTELVATVTGLVKRIDRLEEMTGNGTT